MEPRGRRRGGRDVRQFTRRSRARRGPGLRGTQRQRDGRRDAGHDGDDGKTHAHEDSLSAGTRILGVLRTWPAHRAHTAGTGMSKVDISVRSLRS